MTGVLSDAKIAPEFDEMQLEFLRFIKLIDPNCKRCFGRGYDGIAAKPIICRCVTKKLNSSRLSGKDFIKRAIESLAVEG